MVTIIIMCDLGVGGASGKHREHIFEKPPNSVSVIHTFEDPTQSGLRAKEFPEFYARIICKYI